MIKTNSLNKNEANTGCKRDTPQIETKEEEEEKAKKKCLGCVTETPHRKVNPTWDV